MRSFIWLLCLICVTVPLCHSVTAIYAQTDLTTTVTATIPSQSDDSDTTPPTIPVLVSPIDGTLTGDNRIEFVWEQSSDPNGNTVLYTLYLNGVATYLGISNIGNSAGYGYTARIDSGQVILSPTISILDGVYDWYVVATDLAGNSAHSTTWRLTIDTTPSPLTLTVLDTYQDPVITEGANFDILGPKDIYFTVLSEPTAQVQITITPSTVGSPSYLTGTVDDSGLIYLNKLLPPDIYTITIVAIDSVGNTTALPSFTITITQATLVIEVPAILEPLLPDPSPDPSTPATPSAIVGPTIARRVTIPYTPLLIPPLPATISKLSSRESLSTIISLLLAVILLVLLLLLLRKRPNLHLLQGRYTSMSRATIYHSRPRHKGHEVPQLMYTLTPSDDGKLYIPHLGRYSTLTIRVDEQEPPVTYILSLSAKRRLYTITLEE